MKFKLIVSIFFPHLYEKLSVQLMFLLLFCVFLQEYIHARKQRLRSLWKLMVFSRIQLRQCMYVCFQTCLTTSRHSNAILHFHHELHATAGTFHRSHTYLHIDKCISTCFSSLNANCSSRNIFKIDYQKTLNLPCESHYVT